MFAKNALINFKREGKLFDCKRNKFIGEFNNFIGCIRDNSPCVARLEFDTSLKLDEIRRCIMCLQYDNMNHNVDIVSHYVCAFNQGKFYLCHSCSAIFDLDTIIIHVKMSEYDNRWIYTCIGIYWFHFINDWVTTVNPCNKLLRCKKLNYLCNRYYHDSIIIFMMVGNIILCDDIIIHILKFIY